MSAAARLECIQEFSDPYFYTLQELESVAELLEIRTVKRPDVLLLFNRS